MKSPNFMKEIRLERRNFYFSTKYNGRRNPNFIIRENDKEETEQMKKTTRKEEFLLQNEINRTKAKRRKPYHT